MGTLDRKNYESAIPQLEKRIEDVANSLVDRVYPIGSCYYTSREGFNPEQLGGKWERETNTSPYRWVRTR